MDVAGEAVEFDNDHIYAKEATRLQIVAPRYSTPYTSVDLRGITNNSFTHYDILQALNDVSQIAR